MTGPFRFFLFSTFIALAVWSGYTFYQYLFDISVPLISVQGIKPDGYYAHDTHCIIEGKDEYKIKYLSIKIDDKILLNKHSINNSSFEYHLTIPTTSLVNGSHTLSITAVDASRKSNTNTIKIPFFVDNVPLQCSLIKYEDIPKVYQGNTLRLQFQSNKEIATARTKVLSYSIDFFKESPRSTIYECFIPIAVDEAANEYLATIEIEDQVGNKSYLESVFQIVSFPFKTQSVSVGNKKKPSDYNKKTEQECQDILAKLSNQSPRKKLWNGTFFAPCTVQKVSTDFGVVRTSLERGKYIHNGVDFLALPKSAVWACQDGNIVYVDDFGPTGNTVIIDHGCGIISLYGHLDEFAPIKVGEFIKKGKLVGTIGMSGYATGYHLHWELRIQNIPVNPMEWIK